MLEEEYKVITRLSSPRKRGSSVSADPDRLDSRFRGNDIIEGADVIQQRAGIIQTACPEAGEANRFPGVFRLVSGFRFTSSRLLRQLSSPRKRGSSLWKFSGFLDSRLRGNDRVRSCLKGFWRAVRRLSGDDAYERYLEHHDAHHADESPLTRAEFFRRWQDDQWRGTRRCC